MPPFIAFLGFIAFLAGAFGWIMNIVKLIGMLGDPTITPLFIARIVGVVPFVGAFLGWF